MENNMDNNMGSNMPDNKKRNWIKIVVPIVIVLILAAIWFVKNSQENSVKPDTTGNLDFALVATEDFDLEKLKSYGLPIILDFGSDYCEPCREMEPVLIELNEEMRDKVIIKKIDVMEHQDIVENYPVSVIPTQVFYDAEGKPFVPENPAVYQMKGYTSKDTGEHIFTAHEGPLTKEQMLKIIEEMRAD